MLVRQERDKILELDQGAMAMVNHVVIIKVEDYLYEVGPQQPQAAIPPLHPGGRARHAGWPGWKTGLNMKQVWHHSSDSGKTGRLTHTKARTSTPCGTNIIVRLSSNASGTTRSDAG